MTFVLKVGVFFIVCLLPNKLFRAVVFQLCFTMCLRIGQGRKGSKKASEGKPKDHLFNQCNWFSLFSLRHSVKGSFEKGILSFKKRSLTNSLITLIRYSRDKQKAEYAHQKFTLHFAIFLENFSH